MARLVVTAGPTREPIDPVRYLSNRSTGLMGFALASEALRRGHEVLLVLGPVEGQPPVGADVYGVETAREMLEAVLDFLPGANAVVCTAAVSDYRPAAASERKGKRGELRTIELIENPDIAAEVGARRGAKPSVIFALEDSDGLARARQKLETKNADLCVLNGPAAIGAEDGEFSLVRRDGSVADWGLITKEEVARRLFDELAL